MKTKQKADPGVAEDLVRAIGALAVHYK
jgi:hypothetical protein